MIEKHFVIEEADPIIFYGPSNANLRMLRALCPKLRIVGRGNVLKVMGAEEDMAVFEEDFHRLERHCARHNVLSEEDILDIIKGTHSASGADAEKGIIVYSTGGKPISPRTENQRRLVDAFRQNDMVFAIGPAGTGKTYVAIALAVRALKNREARKIILSRPAVEAGEKLGDRYVFTPKKMGAQTAEANINAGLAAAQEIVDFIENGAKKCQVNH